MSYNKDQERINTEQYAAGQENARREDSAALSGATLGILAALAIAAAAGTFFFLVSRNETAPVAPALNPSTAPATTAPEKQTIIREEKTRELVPVPQAPAQPNINITVPDTSPRNAPSASTAPPSAAASSSPEEAPNSSAQSPAPIESPDANPVN
jgi:hypothetical protein